jgi:hypothetical protein
MNCANCGAPLPPGAVFCGSCGTPVAAAPPADAPPPQFPPPVTPPPPGASGPGLGGSAPQFDSAQVKGFFASLLDIHFKTFITRKLITVFYVLAMIGIGLFFLIFLIKGLSDGGGTAVAVIVIGPIVALLYLIWIRVSLEFVAVVFSLYESIRRIEHNLERAVEDRQTKP